MSWMIGHISTIPPEPPTKQPRTKRTIACNYCRAKKVRCNGERPCGNCVDRNEVCVYLSNRRRKQKSYQDQIFMDSRRLARMEEALRQANVPVPPEPTQGIMSPISSNGRPRVHRLSSSSSQFEGDALVNQGQQMAASPCTSRRSHSVAELSEERNSPHNRSSNDEDNSTSGVIFHAFTAPSMNNERDTFETPHPQESCFMLNENINTASPISPISNIQIDETISSVAPPENSNWEYHGPKSFLSICSPPGIEWVTAQTGVSTFDESAKIFTRDITRPLKLESGIGTERAPEPDEKTAWAYTKTFFETNPGPIFDVVFRGPFEARLRAHFADRRSIPPCDEDPEWYALRNIVYAFGCRNEISKAGGDCSTSSFLKAQKHAWRYFENSLSRHMELVFCRTSVMAVQVLLVMALYNEGIGCPALEYMLCSSAMRLAQSKGLHRQPGSAWGMSPQEIDERNLIFWTLYLYEKQVICRSGRSSTVEDDDISCHLPTSLSMSNPSALEFSVLAIKHSQIASRIIKRMDSISASRESPENIVMTAKTLSRELEDWRESLPPYLQPNASMVNLKLPKGVHIGHILMMQYSYHGSLIAIHSNFTYPWSGMSGRNQVQCFRDQAKLSTEIVATASRNIILATKYIEIDAGSPVWLAFYFPVLGLINLFVHILKYPTLPSAKSDVVLMDVVVGHFARLDFASSGQLAFSFVRDISNLARLAVKNAHVKPAVTDHRSTTSAQPMERNFVQTYPGEGIMQEDNTNYENMDDTSMLDFDMENWSALIPLPSLEALMNFDKLSENSNMGFLSA